MITVLVESVDGCDDDTLTVADHRGAGALTVEQRAVAHFDHTGLGVTIGIPGLVSSEGIAGGILVGIVGCLAGIEHGDEVLHLVVGHQFHVAIDSQFTG